MAGECTGLGLDSVSFVLCCNSIFAGPRNSTEAVFDRMASFRTSEMIHSHDLIQRSAGRESRSRNSQCSGFVKDDGDDIPAPLHTYLRSSLLGARVWH